MADKPKVAFYWCASCGGCEEAVVDLAEKILDVVAAVRGATVAGAIEALGIVETTFVASTIEAADAGGQPHRLLPVSLQFDMPAMGAAHLQAETVRSEVNRGELHAAWTRAVAWREL